MKLLLRDYVASLKERHELDAILPDLLSEAGYHVFSRPAIGTAQRGVDVAAIGADKSGKGKIYLFCVKPGDLTRQEWDGGPQKMRASLNEIIDEYIPTRIPPAYRKLPVVIVICLGGDVHQGARSLVTNFAKANTTRRRSFEEWNGDKIADLLLAGLLREKALPKPLQSHFQKAVAMADQPDVAYLHFVRLVVALRQLVKTDKDRVRVARQIYLCTWILFVWARDADNLDAPYRISEFALLNAWELVKPFIGKTSANARAVVLVVQYLIDLHIRISTLFLQSKITPHVGKRNALSVAVVSAESADVNLRMFDLLGRMAMTGHWLGWAATRFNGKPPTSNMLAVLDGLITAGMQMIVNNPALMLPLTDEQSIEVALFLCLAGRRGIINGDLRAWLAEMASRLHFTVNTHGRYTCTLRDYRDLIEHPRARTDEYRREATAGSTLVPLIAAWLAAFGDTGALKGLVKLKAGPLSHCTLQLWLPEISSEKHFYLNDETHGIALTELPLTEDGQDLLKIVQDACEKSDGFVALSAVRSGYFPLLLTACRHYRLPVPPQYWIRMLIAPSAVAPTP